ncbi:hypothetical protein NRB_16280 [Novosphingobium sp. 11B]
MTVRPIGYYVHHHGGGHRTRASVIAAACARPVVLLGTDVASAGVELADDRCLSLRFDGRDDAPGRPGALHYAPLDHVGVRDRVAGIAGWIARERPALMVVDVSVEVAMLARLASVPTVYVRLNGERGDPPHLEAFLSASALLAPFHPALEPDSTPDWVRTKTRYFPGITATPSTDKRIDNRILVVFGLGGPIGDGDVLAAAARACPQWEWRIIGPASAARNAPGNITFLGWVDAPVHEIARASMVVGAAGDGLVGMVLAADRPFLCIPEGRPFGEQNATAAGLHAAAAAVVHDTWPEAEKWPELIDRTMALGSDGGHALHDPRGVQNAASWLAELADGLVAQEPLA